MFALYGMIIAMVVMLVIFFSPLGKNIQKQKRVAPADVWSIGTTVLWLISSSLIGEYVGKDWTGIWLIIPPIIFALFQEVIFENLIHPLWGYQGSAENQS